MGIKAESLVVALAMPKYQLDQLAFVKTQTTGSDDSGRSPFSRRYITYTDKAFWNMFLKLFSPKEIEMVDPYLEDLALYMRLDNKVVCLGQSSWFNNIDIFFKKEFIHFKPLTWAKYKELEKTNVDNIFQRWCDDLSDQSFHQDQKFTEIYKEWMNKKTLVAIFFKSFIEDWYKFFQTDRGMRLWRLAPALYQVKIDINPSEIKVAEFIFNLIQPHYFFDEECFTREVVKYLLLNKSNFCKVEHFNLVEENNRILHLVGEKNNPIRSEKFWDFPHPDFSPTRSGLVYWSWQTVLDDEQQAVMNKKIIFDLNDFIIDQHYFSGMIALVDRQYELMFLQKTQDLYDKQLEKKLILHFQQILSQDDFWSTWHNFPLDLTSDTFVGPKINCSFIYSLEGNISQHVIWNRTTHKSNLTNYRDFSLLSESKSYWINCLYNVTRILWSELYGSKF